MSNNNIVLNKFVKVLKNDEEYLKKKWYIIKEFNNHIKYNIKKIWNEIENKYLKNSSNRLDWNEVLAYILIKQYILNTSKLEKLFYCFKTEPYDFRYLEENFKYKVWKEEIDIYDRIRELVKFIEKIYFNKKQKNKNIKNIDKEEILKEYEKLYWNNWDEINTLLFDFLGWVQTIEFYWTDRNINNFILDNLLVYETKNPLWLSWWFKPFIIQYNMREIFEKYKKIYNIIEDDDYDYYDEEDEEYENDENYNDNFDYDSTETENVVDAILRLEKKENEKNNKNNNYLSDEIIKKIIDDVD